MNSAERSGYLTKQVENYIKSGFFDMTDLIMKQAHQRDSKVY